MQEYDLLHETDLRFGSPRLDVYLCDDGVSFPSLESGLEAVLDPPLTTSSIVAPSFPSTFKSNTTLIMTFFDPPFSLAQSTEYEVGETLAISASVGEDDTCYESDNAFIEVHDFDATLVGRSYEDVVVTVLTSLDMVDNIPPDILDAFHAFSSCSLPSPSPKCHHMSIVNHHDTLEGNVFDCMKSLGNFKGYDPPLILIACT